MGDTLINITVKDILNNCDAKLLIGSENETINECFVDSKKVKVGGCFFGIKGDKTDGSLYYKQAFDNGANVCVINKIYDLDLKGYDDKTVIVSNDVKKCLQDLAKYKRKLFKGTVIGITGSVGKTSTKDILSNILSENFKVLKTIGNENSQVGLPLTILRLKDEDVMVLEMGMSRKGEMHNLSELAKPDVAVITNVLDSHIGNLGTKENILKAKLEIIDAMESGTLIINNDNDMLKNITLDKENKARIMTYGIENKSNVMASNIKEGIKTTFDIEDITGLEIKGCTALIYNVLAAYLVSKLLGVSRAMIKKGINEYQGEKHRLEIINLDDNVTIIDDAYNASYDSVALALEYMKNFSGRKIAVLGDILELGKESKKVHRKIGKLVTQSGIDYLVTIGKYSKYIKKEAQKNGMKRRNVKHFKNEVKGRRYVKSLIKKNDVLLIKGSNGINLINLVKYIKNNMK